MFASAVYVNATPTTLAVRATVLWIPLHAWPQMDRSAMAAASVSVVPVSAQIQSSKVRPVSCVRLAQVSVLTIKNVSSAESSIKEKRKTRVNKIVCISTLP